MTTLLRSLDIEKLALREFKPDGKDKPTYYINREEGRRENVKFQVGDTEMDQEELPFAILPPASFKDSNPDKPSLMLAVPNAETQNRLEEIERKLCRLVFDNCRDAIKPGASLDYVGDMQTKILRQPTKEGGKVFVSLKLNKTGKYRTNVAKLVASANGDYAQMPATFDDILPQTVVFALVELSPIWFRGKEWGVSLNASDLLIIQADDSQVGQKAASGFVLYNQVVKKIDRDERASDHEAEACVQAVDTAVVTEDVAAEEKQDTDEEPPTKKSRA